jgi:hypothetical protein
MYANESIIYFVTDGDTLAMYSTELKSIVVNDSSVHCRNSVKSIELLIQTN